MKMITLRYYGQLRDCAGKSEECRESGQTAAALYEVLRQAYGFPLDRKHVRVAVNDEFADWQTVLADGDLVVFIPPVSGG